MVWGDTVLSRVCGVGRCSAINMCDVGGYSALQVCVVSIVRSGDILQEAVRWELV